MAVVLLAGVPGRAADDPQEFDAEFAAGMASFNRDRYEDALEHFRVARQAGPDDRDAAHYVGESLLRLRRYDEAEAAFREALALDPAFGPSRAGLGIAQYHAGRYRDAEATLALAEQSLPRDALTIFYRALATSRLGQDDRAVPLFTRAMLLDPTLAPEAHFHRGVAHYRLDVFDEAAIELQAALSAARNAPFAGSATEYLERVKGRSTASPLDLRRALSTSRWDLGLMAGVQYDSNVVLLPLGVQPPGGPTGISRRSDVLSTLSARFEYRAVQTQTWTVGAAYGVYQTFHANLSGFDLQTHTPQLYIQRQAGRLQTRLDYLYDYALVGGSPYLVAHALRPTLTVREGTRWFTQLYSGYQYKDFQHGRFLFNSTRDANNWLAGLMQFFHFANGAGIVRVGYTFDTDRTGGGSPSVATPGRPSHADWSYIGHRFSAGIVLPPVRAFVTHVGVDYYHQQYDNPNSFSVDGRTVRADDIYIATAGVTRRITDALAFAFSYTYTRDKANIPLFNYERNVVSFSLIGTF